MHSIFQCTRVAGGPRLAQTTPRIVGTTTSCSACTSKLFPRYICLGTASNRAKRHTTLAGRHQATGSRNSSTASVRNHAVGDLFQQAFANPPKWDQFIGSLAASGAVAGTLLDGIHSSVGLQVYDLEPVTAGPLVTSSLVPPLLATFYVVLGLLACVADNLSAGSPATQAAMQRASSSENAVPYIAACFGVLAVNLYISASLFDSQVQPSSILAVLAGLAVANYTVFDRTGQGLGLAVLCGVGAPAAELVLMHFTGCWHYSRPDVGGVFVSWVPLCYAFYVPAVSNLARYLWRKC